MSIGRKCEIERQKSGHAVTRIRTWVVTATTWSTNHYTITARNPAALAAILKMDIQALTVINRHTCFLLLADYIVFSYSFDTCMSNVFVLCFLSDVFSPQISIITFMTVAKGSDANCVRTFWYKCNGELIWKIWMCVNEWFTQYAL